MFDELTPIDWAVATLLGSPAVAALVGDRIDADDNVPEIGPAQSPRDYFPRIIHSGTPHGVPWASALTLGYGDFLFTAVAREDALLAGDDLKESAGRIAQSIEAALSLAPGPDRLGDGKTVHGAQCIDVFAPPLKGPRGKRLCFRGRLFQLIWK